MNTLVYTFDRVADQICINPLDPPFRLVIDVPLSDGPGIPVEAASAPPSSEENEDGVTLHYEIGVGADTFNVALHLRPTEREVLATLTVRHAGPSRLRSVVFPVVPQATNTFDRLLMASAWGDDIPLPCQTIRAFCDGGGNIKRMGMPYLVAGDDEVVYTYPSIMAMQYMVLHNEARSLYVACYGTDDATKTFHAKAPGKYDLELSIAHHLFMGEGEWTSPECSLALLPGGWHDAADLYASHMRPFCPAADAPAWLRQTFHGWIEVMMKREGRPPEHRYADLPRLYREIVQPTGLNVLKISGWCNTAFDRNYPDYKANPELGTPEELKAACDQVRSMGGRVEFYTNMRLVDPDSDFWRNGGHRCICVDEHGEAYIEQYGTSSAFRIACPACPEYRAYFATQVERMIAAYGAGAMQADQTSCNLDHFCFEAAHPHATPATNFLAGLEATLEHVRRVYRKLDSGFYLWGEGCHERFARFIDVHQGHGEEYTWQIGISTPEQFLFTYPDAIVTGHAKTGVQGLCYAHAQGKPFDVNIRNLAEPGFGELLKRFVAVRAAEPAYFLDGVFRDDADLTLIGRDVRAFGLHRRDGAGLLVNLWRPGAGAEQESIAQLKHPRQGWAIRAVDPAGTDIKQDGEWIAVAWTGPVASVVFERQGRAGTV